jgi:poly-gamma-glutamate synthesis protein (capsule biosynthesis protein)
MKRGKSPVRWRHNWWLSVLIVVLVVAAVVIGGLMLPRPNQETAHSPQAEPTTQTKVVAAEGRFLFMGDIFFGRYIDDWSEASGLGIKYPFQNLASDFRRTDYQAWIANLECPSVDGLDLTSEQMNESLTFNCPPKYLPEVAKYWNGLSLGNNHTDNQGADGFLTTQQNLADQHIQYFGAYDPRDHDNLCNVINLNVNLKFDNGLEKATLLPFGFCGYNAVFRIPTDDDIAKISQYAAVLPTFVLPHMGAEYQPAADQLRQATYRSMIEAGAEMVIGNHPHWIQNSEAYNGKLIVYSIGNFIFDQQSNLEVTRSALIEVNLTVNDFSEVEKWSAAAEQCGGNFEHCVEIAAAQNLKRLELTYQFDVIGSRDDNRLVRRANDDELADIKARLDWDATMKALGQ